MIDDINGEYPERHRQRSRHGAAHDERNKLALDAVGVGLKRKHKRGNRADQHFKHQQVVGGEEVFAAWGDAHYGKNQREQRFHDIQRRGIFDVVDNATSQSLYKAKEITLGSSVLGNWVSENMNDKKQINKVYVDSETKFHFTIMQYYENFAPSIFTYEGQITGVSKGVAACIPVFMGAYLSHGSYNEETRLIILD